eukprot:6964077-Heterocapsa_arctica.AAC.1
MAEPGGEALSLEATARGGRGRVFKAGARGARGGTGSSARGQTVKSPLRRCRVCAARCAVRCREPAWREGHP